MADAVELDDDEVLDEEETPEPGLLRSDAAGIAGLALNRPDAFNALSRELLTAPETSRRMPQSTRSRRLRRPPSSRSTSWCRAPAARPAARRSKRCTTFPC